MLTFAVYVMCNVEIEWRVWHLFVSVIAVCVICGSATKGRMFFVCWRFFGVLWMVGNLEVLFLRKELQGCQKNGTWKFRIVLPIIRIFALEDQVNFFLSRVPFILCHPVQWEFSRKLYSKISSVNFCKKSKFKF
jgi:hypothetical protein